SARRVRFANRFAQRTLQSWVEVRLECRPNDPRDQLRRLGGADAQLCSAGGGESGVGSAWDERFQSEGGGASGLGEDEVHDGPGGEAGGFAAAREAVCAGAAEPGVCGRGWRSVGKGAAGSAAEA